MGVLPAAGRGWANLRSGPPVLAPPTAGEDEFAYARTMLAPTFACVLALAAAAAPSERFADFYYRYAQAIVAGDSIAARSAWWPADLKFSERLRQPQVGAAPRIDGASPLVAELPRLRAQLLQLEVATLHESAQRAELELRVSSARDTLRHRVLGQWHDERWWLRHPILLAISDWPIDRAPHLMQVRHPSLAKDDVALLASSDFVTQTIELLQLDAERRARMRTSNAVVVLAPESIVTELAGVPTEGVANRQLDLVLTSHAYHPHELAHLLVDFARGASTLATHPLLEEGLAVWLGGRSDATREDQLQLGALALGEQLVDLERLLAPAQFGYEPTDFSYAASAVVVDALLTQRSLPELVQLVGELSAAPAELYAWNAELVRERIQSSDRQSAQPFAAALQARIEHWRQAVFRTDPAPRRPADLRFVSEMAEIQLWWQDKLFYGLLTLNSPESAGALRWTDEERFELRFSAGEIGLYDVALGKRLAKRVDAFAPDAHFWDAKPRSLRFAIELTRLPNQSRALRVLSRSD